MDTNKKREIKIEELVGLDSHLESYLSKLNSKDIDHRQLAIKAIELYIKKYIEPAMYLPDTSIEGVIGNESLGFPLSVFFDSERTNLSRPSDKELTEILKMTVDEPTSKLRDDFWAAWLLREAVSCIKTLCNFLKEPLIKPIKRQVEAAVLEGEIRQLQEIYKIPMTGIRSWIESLIEREKKSLLEWSEDTTIC